ncbi:MAG: hypothetical protein C0392_01435, partial [Syntrophus sp. (in: bacteria)]|nr:hypothetical protein [Syntrophus sp. (in: bacteria)]
LEETTFIMERAGKVMGIAWHKRKSGKIFFSEDTAFIIMVEHRLIKKPVYGPHDIIYGILLRRLCMDRSGELS